MQNFTDNLLQGPKGVAHVLTGTNGVGKTTFMLDLRQQFTHSKVTVSLCTQKPLATLNHWRVIDLIQYLEEEWNFSLDLNLLESLKYKTEMGLLKNFQTPVMKLSGGENQILKLYLCLAMKADFYFLDEPSTFLDKGKREFLLNLLQTMKTKGKTFFFIEHDHDFIRKLANQVWEMKDGRTIVKSEEIIHA